MAKNTLGLAMIMQNEESHIPAAIAQFFHVVDDIVVVDGGSTDGSVEWAEKMGARVFHRPFDNDFSAQKNYAIEQLDTDWVYLHDPDERLEPTLIEILPYIICPVNQKLLMTGGFLPQMSKEGELFDCIGVPRKNFIDGIQTPIYPDYQYRIFANYCRFEGAVHEKIINFKNRTELDYTRPTSAMPEVKKKMESKTIDTERGQLEPDVKYYHPDEISRFNILHYKSGPKQEHQDELYRRIREGN